VRKASMGQGGLRLMYVVRAGRPAKSCRASPHSSFQRSISRLAKATKQFAVVDEYDDSNLSIQCSCTANEISLGAR
jgi:hypothetical protein